MRPVNDRLFIASWALRVRLAAVSYRAHLRLWRNPLVAGLHAAPSCLPIVLRWILTVTVAG
jgi:hypothetical protein